jgi:hypothetical protein
MFYCHRINDIKLVKVRPALALSRRTYIKDSVNLKCLCVENLIVAPEGRCPEYRSPRVLQYFNFNCKSNISQVSSVDNSSPCTICFMRCFVTPKILPISSKVSLQRSHFLRCSIRPKSSRIFLIGITSIIYY